MNSIEKRVWDSVWFFVLMYMDADNVWTPTWVASDDYVRTSVRHLVEIFVRNTVRDSIADFLANAIKYYEFD